MNFVISGLIIFGWCITFNNRLLETAHFKIFYSTVDDKNITGIADSLEGNYFRIINDLQCPNPKKVYVHLYADTASYREGVRPWNSNLPAWSTGSTLGDSVIHMISPNAPKQDYREMVKSIIHEFAHCVSRRINRKIANNPRWYWEAVAVYESNQEYDPRKLQYLVDQKPPTLKELNDWSSTDIYDVGYFIIDYIVKFNGTHVLNTLIKNNGNTKQTLNLEDEEFTKQWFDFVKKKYGI